MQPLLVLSNPSRRRRRKSGTKARRRHGKRRTMSALQRKYFGGGRKRRAVTIHANPAPKRRGRRRSAARAVSRRRQRGSASIGMLGGFLKTGSGSVGKPLSIIGPALTGAIGAVAVHAVTARLPLPANLLIGKTRFLTQAGVAIGLGVLAARFGVGSAMASKMAEGSLTVTLTELIKEVAVDNGVNLGGMGIYFPGRTAGAVPSAGGAPAARAGMGRYLTGPGARVVPMRQGMRGFGNINTFKF